MGDAACQLARAAKYVGVGTVEFLVDENRKFYFMEMNTRIQVEHPVTEMVTGLDLVEEQIRVARGEKLRYEQSDIKLTGHSIECRINAEDPYTFIPCPGTIQKYLAPGGRGVRLDSAAFAGSKIPPFYDSMIGKLIVTESNREKAIDLMLSALAEFKIEGIKTNIPLHREMMMSKDYRTNNVYTKWIEEDFLKSRSDG
jgi:acetyl-CoA carboxylase biotin carboxylase subunit